MSYSTFFAHRSMVFDDVRNALYAKAIRDQVTSESVVLDLGAGLGVLGLIAAAAGAKRVYLVEPEPLVRVAMDIARINGLADRIVILEGTIEDVKLPEEVDLIISVFTGNLLYSEDLLPSLFHARDHYLKTGGQMIPDFAELLVAPISAPAVHAKYVGRWSQPNQGLDCTPARRFAGNETLWLRREEQLTDRLGSSTVLSAVDLMTATQADCNGAARCRIDGPGLCHGLLGWIRIKVGDQWLSAGPDDAEVHWAPVILPLDPPLPVVEREEVVIKLQRPVRGDWAWSVAAASGLRRNSSFLARVDGPRRLRKMGPDHRPGLDRRGENTLCALQMMQEGRSNQEIAEALAGKDPASFATAGDALQLVQRLALRYAGKP